MPSTDTRVEVAVGLVHQAGDLHAHLRDALRDLGASIVYETETAKFDRAALDRSGAQVVVVNLDPDSDEQVDAIDDLLVDDRLKVVFNDGEVTSKLSGYDLARWARHLAAKIVGDADLLPPRPEGAEAVPVRSMPQHALTNSSKPRSLDAPSVSDQSMREATDAIADALASFDMHTTKLEAKNAPAPSTDLNDLLGDFGLSDVAAPSASAAASAGDSDNPFADLGLELDFAETDAAAPVVAASTAAAPPETSAADDLLAFADFNFDEPAPTKDAPLGLDDLLAQQPRLDEPKAAPTPIPAARTTAETTAPAPAVRKNLLEGLSLSLEPQDDAPAEPAAAAPAPTPTAKPADIDFPFDLGALSLEPLDDSDAPPPAAPAAPAKPAPAAAAAPAFDNPFADLGLSLEPLDDVAPAPAQAPAAAAPTATAPAAVAAAEPEPSPFDGLDFSLDDIPSGGVATGAPAVQDDEFNFSLDETVELSFEPQAADSAASNQDEDDFMREFAAMTAGSGTSAQAAPAASAGPLARVWVLGASIGGPDAVREFLSAIPPSVPATFVLAQHMGADFVDLMVAQLQKATRMPVSIPTSGARVGHGQVLVVPIAERMLLDPSGEVKVVALDDVSPYSPSIDRVLIDVADRFGTAAGAIIFSGMAHDAIEGAKHLAAKGGQVWVQDPSTCVVSSMIDGAMEAGIVGFIGTPADLAAEFVRRFGKA